MITILDPASHVEEDFDVTNHERLECLWKMEDFHFWHKTRNKWIVDAMRLNGILPGDKILEVGCGSGGVARALVKSGFDVTGIDTAEILINKAQQRMPNSEFFVGRVSKLPTNLYGKYAAICFFDVLEHLDNPVSILQDVMPYLNSRGKIFVSLPAQQKLWSVIDQAAGHKKRYELGEMTSLFDKVNLKLTEEYSIFIITGLIQKIRRIKCAKYDIRSLSQEQLHEIVEQDMAVPPRWVNYSLEKLCAIELKFLTHKKLFKSGASLLAVGQKSN
jgi:2-polyprenyl-3-methyl-5-hydroxy-6-metoxy-1,4-benzoquinol methylase